MKQQIWYLIGLVIFITLLIIFLFSSKKNNEKYCKKSFTPPKGKIVKVNDNVNIYVPEVTCTSVTCPKTMGECQPDGTCKWKNGFVPLLQYPHAMSTNYCELETGGCAGSMGDPRNFIAKAREHILSGKSLQPPPNGPVDENTIFGVTAPPPIMVGNSGEGVDTITGERTKNWGQGMSPYTGIAYDIIGPGGGRAIIFIYDRCAGYCGSSCGDQDPKENVAECGHCASKQDANVKPGCPCVGTVPGLYDDCCGLSNYGCSSLFNSCDWCASQNHPHFDLDNTTYNNVCKVEGVLDIGSCELKVVTPFQFSNPLELWVGNWPPSGTTGDKENGEQCLGGNECQSANCSWNPQGGQINNCTITSKSGCCCTPGTDCPTGGNKPVGTECQSGEECASRECSWYPIRNVGSCTVGDGHGCCVDNSTPDTYDCDGQNCIKKAGGLYKTSDCDNKCSSSPSPPSPPSPSGECGTCKGCWWKAVPVNQGCYKDWTKELCDSYGSEYKWCG